MDPKWLFPVLAIVFAALAAIRYAREHRLVSAVRTWVILAAIFAAVSVWLHMMS